jgi:DNA-binding transcriptional LysR family regulator
VEAELGAELLDRSTKPPRLNSLGSKVLERARDMLQRTEALRSLASPDAEPHGLLRIGLAQALAEGTLIEPIRAVTEKHSKVQLRLVSGLTGELFNRLLAGELDVAAISGQSEDKWNLRRFSFQILTCWITEDCRESPSVRFNFTAEFC